VRARLAVGIAVLVALLLLGGRVAVDLLVNLEWFRSLGLEDLFWRRWRIGVAARTIAAVVAGVVVAMNLAVVARSLGSIRVRRRYGNLEIAERLPPVYVRGAIALMAIFSGWWIAAGVGDGLEFAALLHATPWGATDPVLGKEISFYVFTLPVLARVHALLIVLAFWCLLLAVAAYAAIGAVRWSETGPQVTPPARRHLGVLAAAFLALYAAGIWLGRYDLLVAGHGVAGAPGYTDVHVRIPARAVVAMLALIAAAGVGWGIWEGRVRLPAVTLALLLLGSVVGLGILPTAVQRLRVEPDELARETPFIEHNLAFTRAAYGLEGLLREPLIPEAVGELPPERVHRTLATLPLWDTRPLLQAYQAQQALFPYFDFASVYTDRYTGERGPEQVAISLREVDVRRLPPEAQTWQNVHLTHVRGQGAVVSPMARMEEGGEPYFYLRDLEPTRRSPDAPATLDLTVPAIYFGERTRDWVIVREPEAAAAPRGAPLDGFARRLLFAWAFQSKNILLSGEVGEGSRIVYRRGVRERVLEVAPFLTMPPERFGSAYPVVNEGRITWVVDLFTSSRTFPFSRAARMGDEVVRYIRSTVKATVDAATGEVRLYGVEDDPILATYRRIFPGLLRPISELPPALAGHLRTPLPYFAIQVQVLREYHLRDARAFYSREDVWDVPREIYRDQSIVFDPYYAVHPLPGETEPEYLLVTPFVARGRQNMTALFVARNDAPHLGELRLYELPRDVQVAGPQQIEAMIDQDPAISEQLALWKRGGSDVIRGNLMVVPVGTGFVYVEPIFLVAQESAIPQLERVIVATGRRVVMRPSLEEAVFDVLTGEPRVPTARRPGTPSPAAPDAPAVGIPAERARQLLRRAEDRLRAGDWSGFGAAWEELRQVLDAPAGAAPPR
jgi:uncharacterized protein